ncbi:MAG: fumarylacetoacetate hydrolase family protein [Deltaproteobacteria bacterium]|nr:fumarylacetoacetate hydrolase family protein [Deltaproteobacteria bacterium]
MRLCRYELQGEARYGELLTGSDEGLIQPLVGRSFTALQPDGQKVERASVRLLTPVLPSKLVCVGRNYAKHAKELGNEVPESPLLFLKPPSALLPTELTIRLPRASERVEHEGELAVVIGKLARHVKKENALEHVFGYACFNDVTARDIQKKEVQFTRAKGFDTFAPFGPFVQTELDPRELGLRVRVNGELRQEGNTRDMVFDVPALIAHASACMTLLPGDIIATGTPEGVGPLVDGDVVEVEIDGLGVLRNPVAMEAD